MTGNMFEAQSRQYSTSYLHPIFVARISETLALIPRINQAQIKTWAFR